MRLGIFAKIFARPTLVETLDAVVSHGLDCIQFNFACVGLPTLPDNIPADLAAKIGREISQRKLSVAAVSGTFNMIDPDVAKRQAGLRRLDELAGSCAALGAPIITLCTGTRDPQNMWRHHPENQSPEAWRDLLESLAAAIEIAEKYDIVLGIEPETANVINSAKQARRLLNEMQSSRLKIVMDASNLFHPGATVNKNESLNEAFDLLGKDIVSAHAKDFCDTGKMEYLAPGKGEIPWALYLKLLRVCGFGGPLVMHSLPESDVNESSTFLRQKMKECERPVRLPISADFTHDGLEFKYQEVGRGVPFFFQHGLGGDISQPFGLFHPPAGYRLLCFDCRAHGQTRPVGTDEKISLASFADDLLALMDHLKIERAVIGGVSMGAAVALNFAMRYPHRVRALILQRPAWLDGPRQDNIEVFATIAQHLRRHGAQKGLEEFKLSPLYKKIQAASPDTAKSLTAQFLFPRAEETVIKLERIPIDSPNCDRAARQAIDVPTLVMANRQDPVHPFEYGVTLAREIPGAEFKELTPKSRSLERFNEETQQFIEDFLLRHF